MNTIINIILICNHYFIKILINEYNYLQKIEKKFFLRKPHKSLLWYEKQNFANFEETVIKFKSFLSNN